MKKRVSIIILIVLTLCVSALVGCKPVPKEPEAPYEVSIDESMICTTYNGGEVLVINVDVTNLSEKYVDAFIVSHSITAKLDGTTLNTGYLSPEHEVSISNEVKIAAGETDKVQLVYELPSTQEGEVNLLGITMTERAEQVEFMNETIDLAEVEKMVVESNYELTVDNVLKTDDGNENEVIIIDMTFDNNSEEAISFNWAIDLEIFQNGTQLKEAYLSYRHPAVDEEKNDNNRLDIQGGNTIQVRKIYTLNDSSAPIEVKAVDAGFNTFDTAPLFENVIEIQ